MIGWLCWLMVCKPRVLVTNDYVKDLDPSHIGSGLQLLSLLLGTEQETGLVKPTTIGTSQPETWWEEWIGSWPVMVQHSQKLYVLGYRREPWVPSSFSPVNISQGMMLSDCLLFHWTLWSALLLCRMLLIIRITQLVHSSTVASYCACISQDSITVSTMCVDEKNIFICLK